LFFFYVDDQATFLTLWAGSVFNARPRCEDPLQGEGSTLVWCDVLSVTVGLVDIVVVAAIGVCFAYIKIKSTSIEVVKNEVVPVDSRKKNRRLSSRELMIEMATQHLQTNAQEKAEEKGNGKREVNDDGEGGEVTTTLGINPMHATCGETAPTAAPTAASTAPETATPTTTPNALKQTTKTSRPFRNGGKQQMKRLSKVMKARQNVSGGEMKTVSKMGTAYSIHLDARTGRLYSYNAETNETKWLAEDEEQGGATQGETKNHSTKRKSFRKIVGGEKDYFVNVETGDAVWYLPEDGEEVSRWGG
jgi:hypothetical protein